MHTRPPIQFQIALLVAFLATNAARGEDTAAAETFFESKVRPLLIERCYECHSREFDEAQGGLRVDSAAALAKGGSRGAAIVAGDPAKSLLVKAVLYDDDSMQMPPEGKLKDEEIEILRKWVASGAYDPRVDDTPDAEEPQIDWRQHWAFQPPQQAAAVDRIDPRSDDPIDAVALDRMAREGIESSGPTDRETWLRRVYFDLIGLPPTRDEIDSFLASERPDAARRVVDNLLARPEYGERWGRHWMDVARYADTVGYAPAKREPRLLESENYRDWLIRVYNDDMPFDRQVTLQLAADTIAPKNEQGDLDAMGFLTIGRRFLSNEDIVDDRIDVVTRGLLGLTVQCARCHDHKFDPIPTMDYYSLVGVMKSSEYRDDLPSKLALFDKKKTTDHPVWVRGQRGNRGPIAPRRFLTALHGDEPPKFTHGSGRLDLAQAIVDHNNPLTRRVLVNRVWMHLMGKPIVGTPSDYGVRTEQPVQVAVLDDLAVDFAEQGDSIKHLVRRIANSYLYRQSSQVAPEVVQRDPDNWYFARGIARRRDFESLRDTILASAGQLDLQKGGAPVVISDGSPQSRRTVYAFIDRQKLPALFRVFDVASPDAHEPQRYYTTVPQQSLYLMNSPFILDASIKVADVSTRGLPADSLDEKINALFLRVLKRQPTAEELQFAIKFCQSPIDPATVPVSPASAWDYGYGNFDETRTHIPDFKRLPHFQKGRWAGGPKIPDEHLQYTSLTPTGGHPGDVIASVRRWTAPQTGEVTISCEMKHPSDKGDGVRMSIASAGKVLFEELLMNSEQSVRELVVQVKEGQVIDFVAEDNISTAFDSYQWTIQIRFQSDRGVIADFDSKTDFSGNPDGKQPRLLSRFEQLAHALLISNELTFID